MPVRTMIMRGAALIGVVACSAARQDAGASSSDAGVDASDAAPSRDGGLPDAHFGYRATVLRMGSFVNDGHTYPVVFARVDRPDGGRTYVQWVASDQAGPRGAVLATLPYVGVDWTGEEVDTRWSQYPIANGLHLDVDGPDFDGKSVIVYEKQSPTEVSAQGALHLVNGLSTLFVFGRFYAGGSVREYVEDMRAGTFFLAEQANVDRARIGVFGASWGGFEALYASAYADPRIRPTVTVAAFPPSDFPSWSTHAQTRSEPASGILVPYVHRILVGVKGGDYTGLRATDLCAGLPKATFLLHDAHDNLVPVTQSQELARRCGADTLFWPRSGALDPGDGTHGPLRAEVPDAKVPTWYTYALVYLHSHLVPAEQPLVEAVQERALVAQLTNLRAAQLRGEDVSYAAPRLRELLRPSFLDFESNAVSTGRELVARAVNAAWATSFTKDTVTAGLVGGLPSP